MTRYVPPVGPRSYREPQPVYVVVWHGALPGDGTKGQLLPSRSQDPGWTLMWAHAHAIAHAGEQM